MENTRLKDGSRVEDGLAAGICQKTHASASDGDDADADQTAAATTESKVEHTLTRDRDALMD